MKTKVRKNIKGFTLIELLVVVAIISLLSSIVFASLNSARAKARDSKKIQEFRQLVTAFNLYLDKYGRLPNEGTNILTNAFADNFNSAVTQLKTEGFLSGVPTSTAIGGIDYSGYNYYNYGPGSTGNNGTPIGGLLVTYLEGATSTTAGLPPSCRPYTSGTNWCDASSTKYYCICIPY